MARLHLGNTPFSRETLGVTTSGFLRPPSQTSGIRNATICQSNGSKPESIMDRPDAVNRGSRLPVEDQRQPTQSARLRGCQRGLGLRGDLDDRGAWRDSSDAGHDQHRSAHGNEYRYDDGFQPADHGGDDRDRSRESRIDVPGSCPAPSAASRTRTASVFPASKRNARACAAGRAGAFSGNAARAASSPEDSRGGRRGAERGASSNIDSAPWVKGGVSARRSRALRAMRGAAPEMRTKMRASCSSRFRI